MTTAILVPSLGRAHRVETVYRNISEATSEDHVQLWMAHGDDYRAEFTRLGFVELHEGGLMPAPEVQCLWLDDSHNNEDEDYRYVTRNNKLAKAAKVLGCEWIFFGQDDVDFHEGWLSAAIAQSAVTDKAVVLVNDLHNPNGTAALMRVSYMEKAVFDQPGLVFHPGYQHNFADNEQHYTALMRNEVTRAKNAVVEHLNPVFGPSQMQHDDTYRLSADGWDHDAKLWRARREAIEEHFA